MIFLLMLLCLNVRLSAENEGAGGILDKNVNSSFEDYGAFVVYGENTDTLFFTSSRPAATDKIKKSINAQMLFSTRPAMMRLQNKPINEGWSQAREIVADASRISEYTRGSQAISSDRIIFAAERDLSTSSAVGTSYLFDLWQMMKTKDGFSSPEPLSTVNDPDAWDSQPALSGDSKVLYFVSNRKGGAGGLDIWYSIRDAKGAWGVPKPVPVINTAGDEVSPHCGSDGKFYFSTNWDFSSSAKTKNKNVYRADYRNSDGIELPVNPVQLDNALNADAAKYGVVIPSNLKINSDMDEEFPFICPDRKSIFFTSNKKADFDKRNIYAYSLPKSRILLQVNVSEQTFDSRDSIISPAAIKLGLPLTLLDVGSNTTIEFKSGEQIEVDAEKNYQVKFSKFVEEECYKNKIEDKSGKTDNSIHTSRPYRPDTLYMKDFLISRKKVDIPPIIFQATEKLPFFVTGYWWPNTSDNLVQYRSREHEGFFNQSGFIDSTGYNYDSTSKVIDQIFETNIYQPLEKILPIFQDFCRDTLFLKVTVHGYTDPRGLSGGTNHPYRTVSAGKHIYPDESITVGVDERNEPVKIFSGIDMWRKSWPIDPNNTKGTYIHLPDDGENGNVLLSKLRAYFTFQTFDRTMSKRSPIYSQLKNNMRVILDAEGFGVDKKRYELSKKKDDPQSRRIEIYLDILRPEDIAYHKRLMGGDLKEIKIASKATQTKVNDASISPASNSDVKTSEETKPVSPEPIQGIIPIPQGTGSTAIFIRDDQKLLQGNGSVNTVEIITESQDKTLEKSSTEPKVFIVTNTPAKAENQDNSKPKQTVYHISNSNAKSEEQSCYSIQYNTYENEVDAQAAKRLLDENKVEEVKIIEFIDQFGSRAFRLRSGCYDTAEQAVTALKGLSWTSKLLNLSRRPVVVR
ncbi:MAG: hypothetical protein NT007_16645 [Candidatus Kapabacteria bacterium]|nr:hypothetical protein [Candidatus Kapabacteria bacterium]